MLALRRATALTVCVLAAVAVILPATTAGAATGDFELTPGWTIHSAVITCPGAPGRAIDGKHAAAFIQAWYPASIYGTLTVGKPPAGVAQCTFLAKDTIRFLATDNNGKTTSKNAPFEFKAFYVTQGNKAWIGLPPQVVGPGATVPALKWYVATPRSILAWQGKVPPLSNTTTTTTSPTTSTTVADGTSSSSGNSAAVIIAVVAGIAILGVGAVIVRSRRKAGTT